MKITILAILFFFFNILQIIGQQYNFVNFTVEHGLVQSQVTTFYEDSRGYLWIGTNGGLSMFDGIKFTNYTNENGLTDNQVRAICEDADGNIWIGTKEGALCYFDGTGFKTAKTNSLRIFGVSSIAKDKKGKLFFGTEHNGLFTCKGESFSKLSLNSSSELHVNSVMTDMSGNVWVGTEDSGLFLITNSEVVNFTTSKKLAGNSVNSVFEDKFGNIWVATKSGLSKFSNGEFHSYFVEDGNGLTSNNVNCIVTDRHGALWLGTSDAGLFKYDGKNFINFNKNNGLENDNITSLATDRSGVLWIGSYRSGFYKYDGDKFMHFTTKDGLANNIITAILEDHDKNIWFGTYGSGVCKYDGHNFTYYTVKDGLCSDIIYSMLQDNLGNIWFGSKGDGVTKFDGKKFKTYNTENGLSSNLVYSICLERTGNVILGTLGGGLNIFDGDKFTVITKNEGLSSNSIYFVFQDRLGNLFIGTEDKGVDMIFNNCNTNDIIRDKKINENNLINISKKFGLSNEQVLSIAQDIDDNIWFGTHGGGVCKFDGKRISSYSVKDGLNSNNIFFLLADSRGYIWAGSEKGINRLFLTNRKSPQIKVYGQGEGYRGIESSLNAAIEDSKGFLWFATVKGVAKYDAVEDLPGTAEPKTTIVNVKLFSENVDWSQFPKCIFSGRNLVEVNFPHDKNHLTFEFAGIDLRSPDKVRFQWMLEGYDKKWSVPSMLTSVTYPFVPEGEYTFLVRSCNNDGLWNKVPASVKVIIKPPFWLTWWFIGSAVLFIVLVIFSFMKFRYSYLEKANRDLEEKIQIRTALLNHEKSVVEEQAHLLNNQKQKLEEINKELEKLSIVARETDNSVMIADKDCRVQWVNEGFHKLYGYSAEDFNDFKGRHISFTSNFNEIDSVFKECVESRQSVIYMSECKTKDERKIWVQTTLTPIFDENNELKQLVAIDTDITKVKLAEEEIKREKEKSDTLLLNILPTETAEELKSKGFATPRSYKRVSVMFTDFKGFTKACEKLKPDQIVSELHNYFVKFDEITEKYYLEKIKTIGDAYMCVGGLPIRNKSHPFDAVLAGLQIQNFMRERNAEKEISGEPTWELRLGIHTGEVVAGVVGKRKFAYDIWGDTVNIASRMESSGAVNMVNVSGTTYEFIKDYFDCEHRGMIEAKNKGAIDMHFVIGIKREYATDDRCIFPNEAFQQVLSEL